MPILTNDNFDRSILYIATINHAQKGIFMNPIDLAELAGGALQEKSQKALQDVFENMQDPNTPWKNKREVVIKLKFTQNEDRDDATCEISVEKKLAQPKPVETKFALGTNLTTGEVLAEEYGPGIKGQISIDEYQKSQKIGEKTVDTETGEIIEEKNEKENVGVVDFRQAKQA